MATDLDGVARGASLLHIYHFYGAAAPVRQDQQRPRSAFVVACHEAANEKNLLAVALALRSVLRPLLAKAEDAALALVPGWPMDEAVGRELVQ